MKLKQAFASREQATKQALYEVLPNDMTKIQAAFKEGGDKWRNELVVLYGEDEANRIIGLLNREI